MSHPRSFPPSLDEFLSWKNCSIPDCDAKVTHNSDKCAPHTYGWKHTYENAKRTLAEIRKTGDSELIAHWEVTVEEHRVRGGFKRE